MERDIFKDVIRYFEKSINSEIEVFCEIHCFSVKDFLENCTVNKRHKGKYIYRYYSYKGYCLEIVISKSNLYVQTRNYIGNYEDIKEALK